MSDTKCAHCGAGMHRLTRWCQKCGKSAGNPVIPITYPTQPISMTPKASTSFPAISFSETASETASKPFAPVPPPPAPQPSESENVFNFLPQSMQPENKPNDGTAKSGFLSQFTNPGGDTRAFNFLPQSMQPAQKPVAGTSGYQVPEYAAVDQGGYAAEQFDSSGVWQEGNLIVAIKDATFPNRCIKCNDCAEPERITRKLTWHHPAVYAVWIFLSPLAYIIVAAIVRKKMTVQIPLCTKHKESRRMITMVGCIIIVLALVFILPSAMYGAMGGFVISFLMVVAGAIVCSIGQRLVTPTKIDNDYVWMKGACEEFRYQLPSV